VPAIKPISDDHELVNAHTLRSIPKWSQVKADGKPRYVETLIFIDSEVVICNQSFLIVNSQLLQYVEQINTRIVILDIMEIVGYNITLEQLSHYRAENMNHLPEHDLAVLIRYGYEGGIAYVNGICTQSAVGITGFLPDSPLEYAAIFFHELAHLFGLTHDTDTECFCGNTEEPCLKIDGFNECSVQTLVDRLPMHECIQKPPVNLPNTVLPICGNHYLEPGEECDCGPENRLINTGFMFNSQTDPEIPIWKTPPYIKNQKTLDGEKDSQSSDVSTIFCFFLSDLLEN
uniref:Peptidase M12B domain-containing protein n=1 Tax=Syphacia muris TaxID=451379 RepID=A0A0N5AF55_9BILA